MPSREIESFPTLYGATALAIFNEIPKVAKELNDQQIKLYWRGVIKRRPDCCIARKFKGTCRGIDGRIEFVQIYDTDDFCGRVMKLISNEIIEALLSVLPEDIRHDRKLRANDTTQYRLGSVQVEGKTIGALYELLQKRDRSRLEKVYGKETIDSLVGHPDNFLIVTQRKTISAEIERVKEAVKSEIESKQSAARAQADAIWKAFYTEKDRLEADCKAKVDTLLKQFAGLKTAAEN